MNKSTPVVDMMSTAFAAAEERSNNIFNEIMLRKKTENNKPYLFLIAWVQGSDSAGGDRTRVRTGTDLYKQFKKGNRCVSAYIIEAPTEMIALAYGYEVAFFANYTAHDSVSVCLLAKHNIRRTAAYEALNNSVPRYPRLKVVVEL